MSLMITFTQLSAKANSGFCGLAFGYKSNSIWELFFAKIEDRLQMTTQHLNKMISV
jgi:hypothetical protein